MGEASFKKTCGAGNPHRMRIKISMQTRNGSVLQIHAQRPRSLLHLFFCVASFDALTAAEMTAVSGNERECHRIRGARSNIGEASKTLRRSHDDPSQSSRKDHKCGNVKLLVREHAGGGSRVREI